MTIVSKKNCVKLRRQANGSVCRLVKEITAVMSSNAHLQYVGSSLLICWYSLVVPSEMSHLGSLGFASYPLPCWSRFRYREANLRLEGAGEELSDQREGTQIEANSVDRRAPLPRRHVGLSRRHLYRTQPLL